MENLIQEISAKLKEWSALFQSQHQLQYGALAVYLLLWLLSSGSLTTTIWVAVGVGLGWMTGRGSRQES
ncbi:MAG: hypothetical protein MAG581_01911 [Deltaproteobacteria bacterium]|jgi:hypothetical protein|nr:hypothetical protein [Deltaproteobacteria bacterium]